MVMTSAPGVGLKSSPIFSKSLQKVSKVVLILNWRFLKSSLYNWATFVPKFVAKNFQKSANFAPDNPAQFYCTDIFGD